MKAYSNFSSLHQEDKRSRGQIFKSGGASRNKTGIFAENKSTKKKKKKSRETRDVL